LSLRLIVLAVLLPLVAAAQASQTETRYDAVRPTHQALQVQWINDRIEPFQTPAPQLTSPRDDSDNWSPVVEGVRGRLIATSAQDAGRPQIRLDLELENVTDLGTPIEIWWTNWSAMLDLSLEDSTGTVLPRLGLAGNEAGPPPFWLALLRHGSMRAMITKHAFEYVSNDRLLLRPTTFQGWALADRTSPLYLRGTLTPKPSPQPRDRAWRGPLAFPRVRVR
jgi:hypothetical protein